MIIEPEEEEEERSTAVRARFSLGALCLGQVKLVTLSYDLSIGWFIYLVATVVVVVVVGAVVLVAFLRFSSSSSAAAAASDRDTSLL